jgi:hypothetical protein
LSQLNLFSADIITKYVLNFSTVGVMEAQKLITLINDAEYSRRVDLVIQKLNSDVVADLHNIKLDQVGEDRVHVSSIKGSPPPPTTRIGVTASSGHSRKILVKVLCSGAARQPSFYRPLDGCDRMEADEAKHAHTRI